MRILVVNSHVKDHLGGSQIQCDLIAKVLIERGHDVLYFAVRLPRFEYQGAVDAEYEVFAATLTEENLRAACHQFKPDVVFWRFNKKKLLAATKVFRRLHIPVVFSVSHVNDVTKWTFQLPATAGLPVPQRARLLAAAVRRTIVARWNHRAFKSIAGLASQNRAFLGRAPVRLQTYFPNSMFGDSETRPFRWQRPFCFWVGNIKQRKNPERFVELADRLRDSPIDFVMAGHFHQREFEWIRHPDSTPSNFHYVGGKSVAETDGILKESLFLVHTCGPEGFPNNFIQAWLRGRPTVSLYYDPDNLIRDQGLGFVSGDMAGLERDVRRLVDDAAIRAEIGARAKAFAKHHFDPDRNIAHLEEFLSTVVCTERRRAPGRAGDGGGGATSRAARG